MDSESIAFKNNYTNVAGSNICHPKNIYPCPKPCDKGVWFTPKTKINFKGSSVRFKARQIFRGKLVGFKPTPLLLACVERLRGIRYELPSS